VPPIVYVLIALVVVAVLYFLFRKKGDEALPEGEAQKPLPPPKETSKAKEPQKAKEPAKQAKPAETPKKKASEPPAKPSTEAAAAREEEDEDEEVPVEAAAAAPAARPSTTPRSTGPRRAKDVAGLRKGLKKTREGEGLFGRLRSLFVGKKEIDPQLLEQIEEVLLTSDVGVKTTAMLIDALKEELSKGELKDEARVWAALRSKAEQILDIGGGGIAMGSSPSVVMVVGVNGVGKTTTIGKLATRLVGQGKKVVLAAGDTFRAAAVQQLVVWGKRAGCEVVTGAEGSNAGAVLFDAVQRAKEIGADVVLADTAGRLHTKTNLMDELKKIAKTLGKALDGAPHETLLVLDATNGQNAVQQAAMFKEALPLSGIVLTKLDGTAKGGVILGICAEHQVPVRYIGIGERAEDLRDFYADEFAEALLGASSDAAEAA
jgi:fused signal recognition particle receptor